MPFSCVTRLFKGQYNIPSKLHLNISVNLNIKLRELLASESVAPPNGHVYLDIRRPIHVSSSSSKLQKVLIKKSAFVLIQTECVGVFITFVNELSW